MRIVSLVPHATELLFALGLGDQVVGVTHECDHPADALERRHVTRDRLPAGLSSAEIDAAVRELHRGRRGDLLARRGRAARARAGPHRHAGALPGLRRLLRRRAGDRRADGARRRRSSRWTRRRTARRSPTCGRSPTPPTPKAAGVDLVARTARRVDAVRGRRSRTSARRPRVAAIEWFDPVFVAGHWTPQLIEMAGGFDVLGFAGEHSEQTTWEAVEAAEPDIVDRDAVRLRRRARARGGARFADRLREVGAGQVVAVDAAATFSRPGTAARRRARDARARAAPRSRAGGAGPRARGRRLSAAPGSCSCTRAPGATAPTASCT